MTYLTENHDMTRSANHRRHSALNEGVEYQTLAFDAEVWYYLP